MFTNLFKSVSEHFSFAEIIHPTSKVSHINKLIKQHRCILCWPQLKADLKCAVLLYCGVRKPVSVWCDHHLPHVSSHRADQVTPLQWLCQAAGYCQELEHAVIYVMYTYRIRNVYVSYPERPRHAQWVTRPGCSACDTCSSSCQYPGLKTSFCQQSKHQPPTNKLTVV